MAKKAMILKQQAKPKFSTRAYNRCKICGRPHAYLRDFGICRICFRELAYRALEKPAGKTSCGSLRLKAMLSIEKALPRMARTKPGCEKFRKAKLFSALV